MHKMRVAYRNLIPRIISRRASLKRISCHSVQLTTEHKFVTLMSSLQISCINFDLQRVSNRITLDVISAINRATTECKVDANKTINERLSYA